MLTVSRLQEAIRGERLDGWLFCNFAHRDTLTDSLLGLDAGNVSSRRWFCLIPAEGAPLKIVHSIERGILGSLGGDTVVYASRAELERALRSLAGKRVAVLCDPSIQVLSTMDAASWRLINDCGIETVSAAPLIQRAKGIIPPDGIDSHERAASALYRIVHGAWDSVKERFRSGEAVHEGDIRDWMLGRLSAEGLVTDHPPIVAAGPHAGDPHYAAEGQGRKFARGDVIQFDIWAKYPGGIYADISWIGFCGAGVPADIASRAAVVFAARDLVKPAIERAFAESRPVTGAELDALVRSYILGRIPESAVRHRTGHGIDTDCHGSGVNLDSIEFPDDRRILEGSCFSVEPGIYFDDSGFRTEIDIYIRGGKPVISGGEIQTSLLTLQD